MPWPLLLPIALLTAAAATGCDPGDDSCASTATCPDPQELDANSDAQSSDVTADGADGGRPIDAGSEADRAAPLDAAASLDAASDARPVDGALPDLTHSDGRFDDATNRDSMGPDGGIDGTVAPDDATVDAIDGASCALDGGRSPSDNPCLISERYGVFVSPSGSDSTGAGTRGAPFRTLARAVLAAVAETRRVYACDDGTGYIDGLTLDAAVDGIELFGGFDCGTWMLSGVNRSRIHPMSGPALVARNLVLGAKFERFDFASANAGIGASSIAVFLNTAANVVFRKARIVAGPGGAGHAGVLGDPGADGNVAGPAQDGYPSECSSPGGEHMGGAWAQASVCGSRGGTGLESDPMSDHQAESGVPMTGVTPPNQWNGGGGILGSAAAPGSPGNHGDLGVPSAGPGVFSANGFTPAPSATGGTEGHTGQGGGGGFKGTTLWNCSLATGGAGGMGGCGGKGALGGGGGGASVGVFSWSSSVSFEECEIVAAAGGAGGNGGNGGTGGLGMAGGLGGAGWATDGGVLASAGGNGGKGGNGGNGGSGAGGNGGPSHALVYRGVRPATSKTTLTPGAPGPIGVGGYVGGVKAPDGAIGASGAELVL